MGDIGRSLRAIILRFLLLVKNQSEVEQSFGSLQTKACPQRPNIQDNSKLEEEIVLVFRKQQYIFEECEQEKLSQNRPFSKTSLRTGRERFE